MPWRLPSAPHEVEEIRTSLDQSTRWSEALEAADVYRPARFRSPVLELAPRQLRPWEVAAKRCMDVLVAATLLVLLSPLIGLIALAVKLTSRGPVLFRQERVGQHGRTFQMLKFRTMVPDCRRVDLGPPPGMPERRRTHKSPSDPRVTALGRRLRRTCLDELPQLWNVLLGDMSLVGPRPELPSIVARYAPWQHARHAVRPGLTGWWQVNRRDGRVMHAATELDLYYVEHQSLILDLHILSRTLGAIIDGSGVY